MDNKSLLKLKKEYEQIEIPSELNDFIQMGVERGQNEMNKRNGRFNAALKICASFIIVVSLFAGGINASHSFADVLRGIPIVGKLVEVLQFTDGKSGGGILTDGIDISSIGLTQEGGYENIIINFSQNDVLQTDVGAFKVRYEENPYTMAFEIGGARRISAKESFEKIAKSKYVKDVYTLITLDDSLMRFVIEFECPVKYEVKEMKEPAGIVISLKEDSKFIEKNMYSLRTRSYPYGEELGILEEKLMSTNPTRILKDDEGMYFVELQLFETKQDALRRIDELPELKGSLFVEERFGTEIPKSYPARAESGDISKGTNKSLDGSNGVGNEIDKSSLYPVSIEDSSEHYYANIEILDSGLNIYSEDMNTVTKYYFAYEDVTLTKLKGEASYKLKIENNDKVIVASGVFADFFEELEKKTRIK